MFSPSLMNARWMFFVVCWEESLIFCYLVLQLIYGTANMFGSLMYGLINGVHVCDCFRLVSHWSSSHFYIHVSSTSCFIWKWQQYLFLDCTSLLRDLTLFLKWIPIPIIILTPASIKHTRQRITKQTLVTYFYQSRHATFAAPLLDTLISVHRWLRVRPRGSNELATMLANCELFWSTS